MTNTEHRREAEGEEARVKNLSKVQQDVLMALRNHGSWHAHCGWTWDVSVDTQRVMDSLVRAGYAASGRVGSEVVYLPSSLLSSRTATKKPAKRTARITVLLSNGRAVDGDDVLGMLRLQHRTLLSLSESLAAQGWRADSAAQKAIADANTLGLEVADRLKEAEENKR